METMGYMENLENIDKTIKEISQKIEEANKIYENKIAKIDKLNKQKNKITNKYLTIQETNTIRLKEKQQQKDDKLQVFNNVMKQEVKDAMNDAGIEK